MAQFDRPYATFCWSAITNIALSCTIFEFLTLNNIVTLKSGLEITQMSLKLMPFESLCAVSVAVCQIFSVKEWHDLEKQG